MKHSTSSLGARHPIHNQEVNALSEINTPKLGEVVKAGGQFYICKNQEGATESDIWEGLSGGVPTNVASKTDITALQEQLTTITETLNSDDLSLDTIQELSDKVKEITDKINIPDWETGIEHVAGSLVKFNNKYYEAIVNIPTDSASTSPEQLITDGNTGLWKEKLDYVSTDMFATSQQIAQEIQARQDAINLLDVKISNISPGAKNQIIQESSTPIFSKGVNKTGIPVTYFSQATTVKNITISGFSSLTDAVTGKEANSTSVLPINPGEVMQVWYNGGWCYYKTLDIKGDEVVYPDMWKADNYIQGTVLQSPQGGWYELISPLLSSVDINKEPSTDSTLWRKVELWSPPVTENSSEYDDFGRILGAAGQGTVDLETQLSDSAFFVSHTAIGGQRLTANVIRVNKSDGTTEDVTEYNVPTGRVVTVAKNIIGFLLYELESTRSSSLDKLTYKWYSRGGDSWNTPHSFVAPRDMKVKATYSGTGWRSTVGNVGWVPNLTGATRLDDSNGGASSAILIAWANANIHVPCPPTSAYYFIPKGTSVTPTFGTPMSGTRSDANDHFQISIEEL